MNPQIVVIAGQTASGKNDLALKLASQFNGIVINGDSRQIYRDLNIGTAKPTPEKISRDGTWYIESIPHYLYGFASLESKYNIYKYQTDVKKIIEKNKNKVIFLTGGTGLYIDSIVMGYTLPKTSEIDFSKKTTDELINMLGSKYAQLNDSDKKNRRRLESLAKRIDFSESKKTHHLYLVLDIPKEDLKKRIRSRVEKMFLNGLIEENKDIFEKYHEYSFPSLQTIGYQEFERFFKDEISQEELKEMIITHTNQYAKRQKTWFKRNKEAKYILNYEDAYLEVSNFLSIVA